jgi:protein-S-isoprenylcysteine O-methyltransferase Ste14
MTPREITSRMEAMATSQVLVSPSLHYTRSWLERARGLVTILILIPFGAAGLLSSPVFAGSHLARFLFESAGWIVFLAGAGFRLWATLYIGGHKGKSLVTEGPYSVCRNPLYLGNLLLTLSIAFFMQSLTFAAGLLIASIVFGSVTIGSEERRLRSRLGAAFDEYCARTPRLLPRWSAYHGPEIIPVDARCLRIEAKRALQYIWIPLICQTLAHLRTEAWWPQWFSVLP